MELKMPKLVVKMHNKIKSYCKTGDEFAQDERYQDALKLYWAAWDLIPEPKQDWETSTWVLAAIGDANFLSGDYQASLESLSNAMHCPDAIGNPFLHLRLGQCQFELKKFDHAADELIRAYAIAGSEIFSDEDPKYIQFLQTKTEDIEIPI